MKNIKIYTDGACSGNPGPGGWGAILIWKKYERIIYGGEIKTTNNRMELLAAFNALKILKESCIIDFYTDSVYLSLGISNWIEIWKKNNWKTSSKKPVKNIQIWKNLDQVCLLHTIKWHWIKGHAGHYENEKVNSLAQKYIKEKIFY